jgi:fatty-acyl-CoA synthase
VKVIGVPNDFYGEEVGACLILKEGYTFDEQSMKEAIEKKLARFKVPSRYIIYDSFPTLGPGKIDVVTLRKDAITRISEG